MDGASLKTLAARGVVDRASDSWAAWTGAAARLIQLRDGAGYIKITQIHITAAGGGGGCANRVVHVGEVGFTLNTEDYVTSGTLLIAKPYTLNADNTPSLPAVILCDSRGQVDYYVVPDAGNTTEAITITTETV